MKKKAKAKNPYAKPEPKHGKDLLIGLAMALCAVLTLVWWMYPRQEEAEANAIRAASEALKAHVMENNTGQDLENYKLDSEGPYVIFLTCSDGSSGYPVIKYGTGDNLDAAWQDALDKILATESEMDGSNPKYFKCDIVDDIQDISLLDLRLQLSVTPVEQFNYGIKFEDWDNAILQPELTGAKPYDVTTWNFDIKAVNGYMKNTGRTQLSSIPMTLQVFTTRSWFYDIPENQILKIQTGNNNYGSREFELNKSNIDFMITNAGQYLINQIQPDGKLNYCRYPQSKQKTDEYSIIRHVCAVWAMCQSIEISDDLTTQAKVKSAIEYVMDHVVYDDTGAAYMKEYGIEEIKSGGAGMMLTALVAYSDVFDTHEYDDLIRALANGLIKTQYESGQIPHIRDLNFNVTEPFYVIYYDGETALGLFRAYKWLRDDNILAAAVKEYEYFIEKGLQEHADHWLAYAANEITELYPDRQEYYEFAFANAQAKFDDHSVSTITTGISPTNFEMLANTKQILNRAIEHDITVPAWFDSKKLDASLTEHAERIANRYLWPEKAMYSLECDDIRDTIYLDTTQEWRIRIDDVQHPMGGYYIYRTLT